MYKKNGNPIVGLVIIVIIIFVIMLLSSGSSTYKPYNQKQTLNDAYYKDKTGQPLTVREQRELDSYKKWEKEHYGNNL